MQFGDLKDLLPVSDGGTRRRLLSGFLIAAASLPLVWKGNVKDFLEVTGLSNATVALAAVLIVYGLGLLVEILGEAMLARAFGGGMWAAEFPLRNVQAQTKAATWLLRAAAYYVVVPLCAIWGVLRGLLGHTVYSMDVSRRGASPQAAKKLDELPAFVKSGLSKPYGDDFEPAWGQLVSRLTESNRVLATRLFSRTRETLALVCSLIVIACLYIASASISFRADLEGVVNLQLGSATVSVSAIAIPIVLLLPLVVFAIHHRFLLSSIVALLELHALDAPNAPAAHAKPDITG